MNVQQGDKDYCDTATQSVKLPNFAYQICSKQNAEDTILNALNKKVKLKFDETPLKEVVQTIGELLKVPVLMDEIAISDEGLKTDQPITFESNTITARSALNVMLEPFESHLASSRMKCW